MSLYSLTLPSIKTHLVTLIRPWPTLDLGIAYADLLSLPNFPGLRNTPCLQQIFMIDATT
jgi:hypothetical protein